MKNCWRKCGKRQFCDKCRDGEDEEGNPIKPKGIMIVDPEDGAMWY